MKPIRYILTLQLLQVLSLQQIEASSTISTFWRIITFHTSSSTDVINDSISPNDTPSEVSPIEQNVDASSIDDCPTIGGDVICAQYWDPYNCTIGTDKNYVCQYYNECAAFGSGYNVSKDCIRTATEFPTSAPAEVVSTSSCPTISNDTFCEESWKPLLCGIHNECQYSNDCYAVNSGFNISTDCTFV